MTKIPTIVAGAACLFASQYAYAADMPVKARPPVVEPGWEGFYIGGQWGGIVSGDTRQQIGFVGLVNPPVGPGGGGNFGLASGQIDRSRVFGGVHAGYNWQWANTVFGLEADINSLGPLSDVLASGRARLGFSGGRYLIYGTAGVAYLHTDRTAIFIGGNGGNGGAGGNAPPAGTGGAAGAGGNGFGTLFIDGESRTGFVGGAGVEWKLTPQTVVGIEALYYAFNDRNNGLVIPFFVNGRGVPENFLTVSGRVSYLLGPTIGPAYGTGAFASWAGLYGGVQLGALFSSSKDAIGDVGLANGQAGGNGLNGANANTGGGGGGGGGGAVAFAAPRTAAFIGGTHAGYNFQFNNVVLGGEADANLSSEDGHRRDASIRARLGFAHQSFLFYATGGVAFVQNHGVDAIFAGNGGNGANGSNAVNAGIPGTGAGGAGGAGGLAAAVRAHTQQTGFVVGAGVEAKISPSMSLGVEGLYYGLSDNRDALNVVNTLGPGRFLTGDNNSAAVIRSRLSIHLAP